MRSSGVGYLLVDDGVHCLVSQIGMDILPGAGSLVGTGRQRRPEAGGGAAFRRFNRDFGQRPSICLEAVVE